MNYQNIENEIKKYSEFFKQSQNTISKLANYYKETGKTGIKFVAKLKQNLDEFYMEIIKEERNTTYNKLLMNFYNEKKNFIEIIKIFFTNTEKNFGDKLLEYEKEYKNKSKDFINKLSNINTNLTEHKIQLDKWKNQYLDFCKASLEIEKKIKLLENEPEKIDAINKLKLQLKKNEEIKELKKKNYKNEQIQLNRLLDFTENGYYNIIDTIEQENLNKMQYMVNIIKDSNQNFISFMHNLAEHLNKIEILKSALNAKKDWKSLKKNFDFSYESGINKEKRFILEEFLDYDLMKNNVNNTNINNNIIIKEAKFNRNKNIFNMGKLYFIDLENLNDDEKIINDIIVNLITNENTINNIDFLKVINFIENNGKNSQIFTDILATHFCKEKFIIIKNYDNFHNLINILIIILNFVFDKKIYFDICFLIIFIAEKCGYLGQDKQKDKLIKLQHTSHIFCFEILSKKTIFDSINFWKDLIDAKIDIVSQMDINKEYNKRMKNSASSMNKNKIFGNIFNNKNDDIESELMVKQIFKEKVRVYFTEVFYNFLKHFTHFNFYKQEELLNHYTEKYIIDKRTVNFFQLVIKSDNIFINHKKLTQNNKSNNYNNINNRSILFNYASNKQFKNIDNKSIKCILFSLKYLTNKELILILCLSKKYFKHIIYIIYKQILLKKNNLDIKTHIMIWKILLKYKEIQKQYNYNKIIESIKENKKIVINENIINLDLSRTHFSKNKEENKIKLGNILRAISHEFPEINYYQGMNQIVAFLLNICDYNEEEAFYLFACILKYTEYSSIYENNLEKMNQLFYQLDRLLNLYLPQIYIHFSQSSINAGYFLSSWPITLYTNFFDDSDKNNNAKNIMMIWDLFIFSGLKIILQIGLIILKYKEKEILEKSWESLLPFLTGELLSSGILDNTHTEYLREELIGDNYKIKKELFDNMIEEFNIKKDIEFFKEGNKINSAF